jgi:hypothetical protein
MLNEGWIKMVTLTTGALIGGEAFALLVGMYILSPRPNVWITTTNTLWIALDIICGAGLLWLALINVSGYRDGMLFSAAFISLGAHAFREWDYFASQTETRFLTNMPLFVVNNVKLMGLFLILAIFIYSFFATRS